MRAKIGATKDGIITAGQLYLAFEAGAFPGSPVGGGALTGFGPYKIEHLLVDGYDVVCNKPKVQGYRAPGQSQADLGRRDGHRRTGGEAGHGPHGVPAAKTPCRQGT